MLATQLITQFVGGRAGQFLFSGSRKRGVRFEGSSHHEGFRASACDIIATSALKILKHWPDFRSVNVWRLADSCHVFSEEARMPEVRIVTHNHGLRKEPPQKKHGLRREADYEKLGATHSAHKIPKS